jgi:hypothetical protein
VIRADAAGAGRPLLHFWSSIVGTLS